MEKGTTQTEIIKNKKCHPVIINNVLLDNGNLVKLKRSLLFNLTLKNINSLGFTVQHVQLGYFLF